VLSKQTSLVDGERSLEVHYLHSYDECDGPRSPAVDEAVSAGRERYWMHNVEALRGANKSDEFAQRQLKKWTAIADGGWAAACARLACSIPSPDAFCVVPSDRTARRSPLTKAMRERFPDALEFEFTRPPGIRFGEADEATIVASLTLQTCTQPTSGARVVVVDDWVGGGVTMLAMVTKLKAEHPDLGGVFCAAPGIRSAPIKASRERP
jgi:hypothetical protein